MFCANKNLKESLQRKRAKKREGKGCLDHNLTTIQVKDVLFRQEVKGNFEKEDGKERERNQNEGKGINMTHCSGSRTINLKVALHSLEEGVLPQSTFEELARITLCQCTKDRNKAYASRLYAVLHHSGLDVHKSLGNYLVPMLVEVGSMCDAQVVFDRLVYRNDWSWNALISGYVKCSKLHHAFSLYEKMQKELTVRPNEHTFLPLLKGCANSKDLEKGIKIHGAIGRVERFKRNIFLGTTLIDMYMKCGSLSKAQQMFDTLPRRDIVTWNALIMGYADHGHGKEALKCFEDMEHEGFSPNNTTFVGILKACGSIVEINKGHEIHAQIDQNGLLEKDIVVGNALIDMYVKCGIVNKAKEVFSKLPIRDVVAWTTLIAGYSEHGQGEKALDCFEHMQIEGVSPDAIAFVCSLKACTDIGAIDKGQQMHADIERKGMLTKSDFIGRTLVDMYAKCGLVQKAQEVFDRLPVHNVVSWTALIGGYIEYGHSLKALEAFELMQFEAISPDAVTFVCALKSCAGMRAVVKGQEIHVEVERMGLLKSNLILGNALVDMYAKCGLMDLSQEVFDELLDRDVVTWNALITGYVEHGYEEEAINCFDEMGLDHISPNATTFIYTLKACGNIGAIEKGEEIHTEVEGQGLLEQDLIVGSTLVDMYAKCGSLVKARQVFELLPIHDVVSWNLLISGYTEYEHGEEALRCFEQMKVKGVSPDAVTFVCSLKACGSTGAMEKGGEIHSEIERQGLIETNLVISNTLIDMYSKCGLLAKAQGVFDLLPVRDVISWTALMAGHAQTGECEHVIHMFEQMLRGGVKPNLVTFIVLLCACSRRGLFKKSQSYFEAMNEEYGIFPAPQHHSCMVDLLGRVGELDTAIAMIQKSPFCPNLVMWHSVLNACKKWGNVRCGQHAFECATLETKYSSRNDSFLIKPNM